MLKARVILAFLTFGMLFMYQLSRFNMNIAIVGIIHEARNNGNSTMETQSDGKAIVLGSFFYMSWVTELTGAYLLTKFGCRRVMALTFGLNAVTCFLFPWSYRIHPLYGAAVRIFQGLILGPTWPAMAWLSSRWIPKNERSRFMSTYHGATFGASCSNLLGGIIIDNFGWPYIFYGTGILSIIWVLFWLPCAYDSPSLHPRISKQELDYLEQNVETREQSNSQKTVRPTPWLAMLTSIPFWIVFLMFFSVFWFVITLAMQMPTYFDMVHNLNIKTNGLLLSIPDILKVVVGIYFPMFVDNLIKKKKITVCTARKLSCGVGCLIPGVILIILAFYGSSSVYLSGVLIIIGVAISGSGSSSILANVVDIAPNFAGTTMGIAKTASNLAGIISPLLVKYVLADSNENWCTIFLINSAILVSSYVLYFLFTSTDIQPWNNVDEVKVGEDVHMLEKAQMDTPTDENKDMLSKTEKNGNHIIVENGEVK